MLATGRAPIVKMSRRIPPTPVAAPWYGSTNDGWLWLSILNTATQPSPISSAPAFSPGPPTTLRPLIGSIRKCLRDDLYEQCSDHITEKTPSSVKVGVRPSSSWIMRYSPAVSPCARACPTLMLGSPASDTGVIVIADC